VKTGDDGLKVNEEVEEKVEEETIRGELTFDRFLIPPNTKFEERNIVVERDIVVGPGCKIGYGLMGRKVIVGEKTTVEGDVVGEEIRLDSWNTVEGNVICRGDAFIGEFTTIEGRLTVFGDLEIGRNVKIKNGFEAKGLITIQDPLPVLIFIFLYLLELLRLGRLEEAEKLFEFVEEIENPLVIPENSEVNLEVIRCNSDLEAVGSRILGNLRIKNVKAEGCEIFGSVRAGKITLDGCRVHGSIEGKTIYLLNGTEVYGSVRGERIYMEDNCTVESSIIGREGVWIKRKVELLGRSVTQLIEDARPGIGGRLTKVEIVDRERGKRAERGRKKLVGRSWGKRRLSRRSRLSRLRSRWRRLRIRRAKKEPEKSLKNEKIEKVEKTEKTGKTGKRKTRKTEKTKTGKTKTEGEGRKTKK